MVSEKVLNSIGSSYMIQKFDIIQVIKLEIQ